MKVEELIKQLSLLDPEMSVYVKGPGGTCRGLTDGGVTVRDGVEDDDEGEYVEWDAVVISVD